MIILICLVTLQTIHNEGRPVQTTTETTVKVNQAMINRTAQLIDLVSHLDDDDPVDPTWTDFRKQYYPHEESYWEDFNLRFNDTEKPLDLYMDLIKMVVDTNREGITGTKQEFATTLGTAPMRKNFRLQHVRNPEVLEEYQRKSKKKSRSTSSSDEESDGDPNKSFGYKILVNLPAPHQYADDAISTTTAISIPKRSRQHASISEMLDVFQWEMETESTSSSSEDTSDDYDDDSDESLHYRRTFDSKKHDYSKRRVRTRLSELKPNEAPLMEEDTPYLRSIYIGTVDENQGGWNQDVKWESPKRSISLKNQDIWNQPINELLVKPNNLNSKSKEKNTPLTDWYEKNIASDDKNTNKLKERGETNEKWKSNMETSRPKPLKTDTWEKQERYENNMKEFTNEPTQKNKFWDIFERLNEPKYDTIRKNFRRNHNRNSEVLDYRRKSKKKDKSTSSDDSDNDSDESLGYRRTLRFQEDDHNRRRMLEIEKIWPEARVSELNFKKVPSLEEETTYLRSIYAGEGKKDGWNKDVEWDLPKKSISWNNKDTWDRPTNDRTKLKNMRSKGKEKNTDTLGWEKQNVNSEKKNSKNWNEQKKKQESDEIWGKNKEISWDDKPLKIDAWEKQNKDKKNTKKDWTESISKMNKWDIDDSIYKPKKAKISEWDSTTQKKMNDKAKYADNGWPEPKKKDSWDSYGNKIKEYDDNVDVKKKDTERVKNKKEFDGLAKIKWDDYNTPQKKIKYDDKADLRSKNKHNNEWHGIGRTNKDSLENKPKNLKNVWDSKSTKGDYDTYSKKITVWDEKSMKKDTWEDKPKKKVSKKGVWENEGVKSYNIDGWDDKPVKKDSWDEKQKKKDSWYDEPVKNKKSEKWDDYREKSTTRWREEKTKRDWDPPPAKKKKYDEDDYYERPRNKYAKKDRDMLNVRTPIPFVGKRGIYEEI